MNGKVVVLDEAQPEKKLLSAMTVVMIAVLIIIAWWLFVVMGQRDDLNRLVEEELKQGAMVVECEQGQCINIATNEVIGEGKDGKYLVYPKDTRTPEELRKVRDLVKQLDR